MMREWTPDAVRSVLGTRYREDYRALMRYVWHAVEEGRARFVYSYRSRIDAWARSKEDDVQGVFLYLFKDGARLLYKYGHNQDFIWSPDALRRYVIGITKNVMRKLCQKPVLDWKELGEELATQDAEPGYFRGFARFERTMDLERGLQTLSPADRQLFRLFHEEQLESDAICEILAISRQTLDTRKSRMLKRLHGFMSSTRE